MDNRSGPHFTRAGDNTLEILSNEQRAFYADNGYLVLKAHLPDDII